MRRSSGALVALIVVAAALTFVVGSASAGLVLVTDPTHDNGPQFDPHGDITAASAQYVNGSVTVSVTVVAYDSPLGSAWETFYSGTAWAIDTTGDKSPEFLVSMFNMFDDGSGRRVGRIFTYPGLVPTCDVPLSSAPLAKSYSVTFPATCIGSPSSFEAQASFAYSTSNTTVSIDSAAWTGKVRDVPPPVHVAGGSSGYWMLDGQGHVYAFGGALGFTGSVPGATAMAPRPGGKGYWVTDGAGHIFTYGDAPYLGSVPASGGGLTPGEKITSISATPDGHGYWLFSNDGRVWLFGSAQNYGFLANVQLNKPIIASAATADGKGYYLVGSDGGIFAFGDAKFHGSTGNMRLNKPVVGISPAPGGGYWLVASDGGVFAFDAPFRGSMGSTHLNQPVDGLVTFGNGYLMVASDGGIFDFSNKPFFGSLPSRGAVPPAPIIGVAAFASQ